MSEPRMIPSGFSEPSALQSPLTWEQAVTWGEMDAFGHVNNTVYLRWFENVRFHYFDTVGLSASFRAEGIGPILAATSIDFLTPVTFPDRIWVTCVAREIGRSSVRFQQQVWSWAQGRLCAKGESVIVAVDYKKGSAVPLPQVVRAAIVALDAPVEKLVSGAS